MGQAQTTSCRPSAPTSTHFPYMSMFHPPLNALFAFLPSFPPTSILPSPQKGLLSDTLFSSGGACPDAIYRPLIPKSHEFTCCWFWIGAWHPDSRYLGSANACRKWSCYPQAFIRPIVMRRALSVRIEARNQGNSQERSGESAYEQDCGAAKVGRGEFPPTGAQRGQKSVVRKIWVEGVFVQV